MNQSRTAFGGFVPPKKNYFPMPNEWINICAEIDNLAELKVIQYVLRHTWGYHEFDGTPKHITIDEFMHGRKYSSQSDRKGQRMDNGTGLSNRSVIDGLKRAVDHKYLICEEDRSDKARIVKAYALNMKGAGVKNLHSSSEDATHQSAMKNVHTDSEEPSQPAMKNVHSRREGSTQRSEKDTRERHSQKNTEKERTTTQPSASVSFSSHEEAERYEWIRQEKVICPKDQAKVIEYVQALLPITSREQMHRLKEVARAEIPGPNKKVFLGNLVSSLDGFLQTEQVNTPAPLETPSQADIEALAAEILREYPEIVLAVKTDQYGPYIEMPNGSPYPDGARDMHEWQELRANSHRLAQVLEYGSQRCLVA
jgi:hypothetical protein